jgi:hypothetical protein
MCIDQILTEFGEDPCAMKRARILAPGWGSHSLREISATGVRTPIASAYNAWVARLNAIRLLQALVAAGANSHAPMDKAWVDKIAVRYIALHGTALASAIAYAEGEGWLADIPTRKGWISLTRAGEVIAQGNDSNC